MRPAAAEADGGTLFLDEICEMDMGLQSKLLRFIQTGTFQRVGSTATEKVDMRFICASNKDPLQEVEEGRFREDLYYRLQVISIHLPPLDAEAARSGGIRALWQVEKDTIKRAIEICEGNIPRAAAHLGISASTIYRKRMAWQAECRA